MDQFTPVKLPDEESLESLSASFTNMELLHEAVSKRSTDRMTVEGTPINHISKRIDLNETPASFRMFSSPIKSDVVINLDCNLNGLHPIKPTKQKVLIMTSGSDEHDTGYILFRLLQIYLYRMILTVFESFFRQSSRKLSSN
jgi:hypothetical protein